MFDDTVYYLSFATAAEAEEVLGLIHSAPATELLLSLIFWDDKRPIKTSILNSLDWTRLATNGSVPAGKQLGLGLTFNNQ